MPLSRSTFFPSLAAKHASSTQKPFRLGTSGSFALPGGGAGRFEAPAAVMRRTWASSSVRMQKMTKSAGL